MILVTGDTHGNIGLMKSLCEKLDESDMLIILGDVGLNYFRNNTDRNRKRTLSDELKPTIFCIRGNHEERPENIDTYVEIDFFGGRAFIEPQFPKLVFAKDGEMYYLEIDGEIKKVFVAGGAYSVDKQIRLLRGHSWFPTEQLSAEEMKNIEATLADHNWKVDIMVTHTAPANYTPIEWFLSVVDQSTVDNTMEDWLEKIEQKLSYDKWYCGHSHGDKKKDKLVFMFRDVLEFGV